MRKIVSMVAGLILFTSMSHAQAITNTELISQIQSLLKIVTELQIQLAAQTGHTSYIIKPHFCGALATTRFGINRRSEQVIELQKFLKNTGDFTYPEFTPYYGQVTKGAVQKYQCREMSICSGSPSTTGYGLAGPGTRGKICESRTIEIPDKIITKEYQWHSGEWSSCNDAAQSREVYCLDEGNAPATEALCQSRKPQRSQSCGDRAKTCRLNGKTLSSGSSITAYELKSVAYGKICKKETRTCIHGALNGSFRYSRCRQETNENTVSTDKKPSCTISLEKNRYIKGDTVIVKWDSHNAQKLKITGIPPGTTYPTVNMKGQYVFNAIQISRTFTCTATGSDGAIATDIENISVDKILTPAQYLSRQGNPKKKNGSSLPPLTRWSYVLGYDTKKELADRWGYTLDLEYYTDADLNNPESQTSRLLKLYDTNKSYRYTVKMPYLQSLPQPNSAYLKNASGTVLNPKTWSPEAPESLLRSLAEESKRHIEKVSSKVPVAIILNGGERGLGVPKNVSKLAVQDPAVQSARGSKSWSQYISEKKLYQEMFFRDAIKSIVPEALYIFYHTGNQNSTVLSKDWDWDFKYMRNLVSYPSTSVYYGHNTSGFTVDGWKTYATKSRDMLSYALNAYAYDRSLGSHLSYNWVNGGRVIESNKSEVQYSDIESYKGYLRSYYNAGMIGGIGTFFAHPSGGLSVSFDQKTPPHWLLQLVALSEVHAEYSYFEDILRKGFLLTGQTVNTQRIGYPAYEIKSIHKDARVLVRKMPNKKRWLISAWSGDEVTHSGAINIPVLGNINIVATKMANIYDVRIINGIRKVALISFTTESIPVNMIQGVSDAD